MLEEMTLSKGRFVSPSLSWTRYLSALMASSPRTAYSTLRMEGLRDSMVRGRMGMAMTTRARVRNEGDDGMGGRWCFGEDYSGDKFSFYSFFKVNQSNLNHIFTQIYV